MSPETAHVWLEKGSLIVGVSKESALHTGVHRIYFANVLGFEPSDDPAGDIMGSNEASDPNLLNKVVDYLREQQVEPELSPGAQEAMQRFRAASDDLAAARDRRRAIKAGRRK